MAERWVNGYVDGDEIILLRRDDKGAQVARRYPAEWVSYHLRDDVESLDCERELRAFDGVRALDVEGRYLRVSWKGPSTRREQLLDPNQQGFPLSQRPHFEGDVDPIRRLLTDRGLEIGKPIRAYYDIETDSRKSFAEAKSGKARILSWAVVDEDGRVDCDVLEADTDAAERALLRRLVERLSRADQIVAWNGERFDDVVLKKRCEHLGVDFDERRFLWLDHMVAFEKMNKQVAESGDEKRSMKLEDIAQATLGRGKHSEAGIVPNKSLGAQTWELWEAGGEWRQKLLQYNVDDALLLRDIEAKNGYLALLQAIAELCQLFTNTEALQNLKQMDGYLFRLGRERNHHFPTKFMEKEKAEEEEKKHEKYKGAQVVKPKLTGLLRDVHVADFKGTYPHAILSFNISPEMIDEAAPINGPVKPGTCRCPSTGVSFRNDERGILPTAIARLIEEREQYDKLKEDLPAKSPEWIEAGRKSNALKVCANAFYGGMGSTWGRYFDVRVAESITQVCVWLIQATIEHAENAPWSFEMLYSDTDSVFVRGCTIARFAEFVKHCNEHVYPPMLAAKGCKKCHIKLVFEKSFSRMCLVTAKRYVATFAMYKGKAAKAGAKPEIKGMEYVRGDSTKYGASLQGKIIDLLMGGLGLSAVPVPTEQISLYVDLLAEARRHVLEDPLPLEEIRIAKGLSQSIYEYDKAKKGKGDNAADVAHVGVAKVLRSRGRDVGKGVRIEYFVADGSVSPMKVLPAEDFAGECDRHYVWEKLVFPPAQRILESAFPHHDWQEWETSRPPKSAAPLKGQLELGQKVRADAPPDGDRSPSALSPGIVPFRRKSFADEVVEIREGEGGSIARLYDRLLRHKGNRLLALSIRLKGGEKVDLSTKLQVSGSDDMRREVEEWRREGADGAITLL